MYDKKKKKKKKLFGDPDSLTQLLEPKKTRFTFHGIKNDYLSLNHI